MKAHVQASSLPRELPHQGVAEPALASRGLLPLCWAIRSASPCPCRPGPRLPPQGEAGAHHETSDLVGAGKEARRVGIHLLVLQPWGRAVGGLPSQGLPEAVCEGRPHRSPADPSASLVPLIGCWGKPSPRTAAAQSSPSIFKSQRAPEGRPEGSEVMKRRPERADLAAAALPGLPLD